MLAPIASSEPSNTPDLRVARAQRGDAEAFGALYVEYAPAVYGLAMRISRNGPEAEDLVQDTFLEVWHALPGFRGESAFGTWLYRIAARVIWARMRRVSSEAWLDLDAASNVPSPATPVAERLDLERAMERLPRGARLVLLLREVHGLSYDAIAQQLAVSIGTVKSQLHRARHLMLEWLD
jgi:RNA polymerase sigma factor (sigma-70 family)